MKSHIITSILVSTLPIIWYNSWYDDGSHMMMMMMIGINAFVVGPTTTTRIMTPYHHRHIHNNNYVTKSIIQVSVSNDIEQQQPQSADVVGETTTATTTQYSIIQELRNVAMRLHTTEQSPKEGKVVVDASTMKKEPYIPTHVNYLQFLIDSQYIYQIMEDIVQQHTSLQSLQNTGLERVIPLEHDIQYMIQEYQLQRPNVGEAGISYGKVLLHLSNTNNISAFICHYYNYYFAHTAGGRMIGKQMSSLLLNKKTLEFYKWDQDLNLLKDHVKNILEEMACSWSDDEKQACINETAAAFIGGNAINAYLMG